MSYPDEWELEDLFGVFLCMTVFGIFVAVSAIAVILGVFVWKAIWL